jgi:protein TonB
MKLGLVFGMICAVLVYAGVILVDGLFFSSGKKDDSKVQQVQLLSDDVAADKDKPKEKPAEKQPSEELKTETEQPPDASEILKNLDVAPVADAPKLDAASLSAIEAALNGQGGAGGDFAEALSFNSGGRLNGHGSGTLSEAVVDNAFSIADIDQKPRGVFQPAPIYPSEMRGKRLEGVVTLIFVVDAAGKVTDPKVENSSNPAFDRPAVEAVKRWKFEPGIKGGQRVPCKMRIPIRFQPS